MTTRRDLFAAAGAAIAASALANRAFAQLTPTAADMAGGGPTAEVKELAPKVFSYVQTQPPGTSNLSVSNAGWIEGANDVLLIDTLAAPMHAQALKAAIAAKTDKPIRKIVITHHHGDHTAGLPYFMPADVIAQAHCRELMAQAAPGKPKTWVQRKGWATGDESWPGVILPTVTFDQSMSLWGYADGPVEIFSPGPAHTFGDAIVRLPAEKVAFIGDDGFFQTTPLATSAYVTDLIAFMKTMLTWDVNTFVPGHGPVGGRSDIEDNIAYFERIKAKAKEGYDKGWSAGRTAAEMDLGRFSVWNDSDRISCNVARLYEEFAGGLKPTADMTKVNEAMEEYNRLIKRR